MDSFKLSFSGSPQVTVLVFSSRTKWSNPSELRNMLAMHRWILLLLAGFLATGRAEDLLELSCSSDAQCAQFERGRCVDMACICTARGSGERVPCTPLEERLKLTNIIGGACPCPMPNAICHTRWQQCHCSEVMCPVTTADAACRRWSRWAEAVSFSNSASGRIGLAPALATSASALTNSSSTRDVVFLFCVSTLAEIA